VQLGRYAFAGLALTAGNAAGYWALTDLGGVHPMISLTVTSVIFLVVGYVTHARYTFRNASTNRHWGNSGLRFVLVRLVGLSINQFWVWLLVKQLGGATWWAILPMLFVTPLVAFVLLRSFVYGRSAVATAA
jgi:putative flippase GtrA